MSAVSLTLATDTSVVVFSAVFAAAVLAFTLAMIFMSSDRRGKIERRLGDLMVQDQVDEEEDPLFLNRPDQVMAETKVMQRVVGLTGRLADRAGLLTRTEDALEQADLPLRPPEALFFYFAGVFVVLVFGVLILPPAIALAVLFAAVLVPVVLLHRRRKKRLRNFQVQLPDTLNLLSGSMRAGFSFAQGLETVANEAAEPTRRELQRVFTESRLGRPIEDALEDSANRMASVDLMWAVMAIRIQREVGGNLAELLDTVADTMTQRERIRGEIKALTAEGRFSGWILGIFPIAFAGVLYIVQPDYISVLFDATMGLVALGVSLVMTGIGFLWLRKILAIEV
jgi:tight adherence protein B